MWAKISEWPKADYPLSDRQNRQADGSKAPDAARGTYITALQEKALLFKVEIALQIVQHLILDLAIAMKSDHFCSGRLFAR